MTYCTHFRPLPEVAIGPAGGLGYIRARAGSRCARISGLYLEYVVSTAGPIATPFIACSTEMLWDSVKSWTLDWTMDWTVDWTGLWTGLDCGLDYGLTKTAVHIQKTLPKRL